MKGFLRFMTSMAGRVTRIIAGIVLIAWGYFYSGGVNWLLIIIGLIPLSAGIFDFCVLAPIFGYAFTGKKIREQLNS